MIDEQTRAEAKAAAKSEALKKVHAEALARFDSAESAVRGDRLLSLQDRRFYSIAGAQYEGYLDHRVNNPKLEVNKTHLAVIKILSEYLNNKIEAKFFGGGTSNDDMAADDLAALHRSDEQSSGADEAYDGAFEEAVGGGFGAWRLRCDYEDEEDEDDDRQSVKFEPIPDADSCVFFDTGSKRRDKSDANWAIVITPMPIDEHDDLYGSAADWQKSINQVEFDWYTADVAYIAEYYVVEKKKKVIVTLVDVAGVEEKVNARDLNDVLSNLTARGFTEVERKTRTEKRVRKYIMSGDRVLEDCGVISGKNIPIVPMYGKRWFIDGIERFMGHVRLVKDVQRLKNILVSKLAEISALSTVEKPIFTKEQMAGHAQMWADDAVNNYPYLLVNEMTDQNGQPVTAGPLGYTKPPQIPQALAALIAITDQDIKDLLGNQQSGEQLQTQSSGIAVELVQNRLDMQTFIYVSSMAKAIKRSAEIWLSIQYDILKKGRQLRLIDKDGKPKYKRVGEGRSNAGALDSAFNLPGKKFGVEVDVGPSSSSRRNAVVRSMTNMMGVVKDAETQQVLSSTAMMNMEGEGLTDLRPYFRQKLVMMGAIKPTPEESEEMAAAQSQSKPDANQAFLIASADQAAALAVKARSGALLDVAKAKQTEAQTVKTLSEVDVNERDHLLSLVDQLAEAQQPQQAPQPQPQQPSPEMEIPQ